MANLQSYVEEDSPSDNPEATVNGIDESKELEDDVNLIVSYRRSLTLRSTFS